MLADCPRTRTLIVEGRSPAADPSTDAFVCFLLEEICAALELLETLEIEKESLNMCVEKCIEKCVEVHRKRELLSKMDL